MASICQDMTSCLDDCSDGDFQVLKDVGVDTVYCPNCLALGFDMSNIGLCVGEGSYSYSYDDACEATCYGYSCDYWLDASNTAYYYYSGVMIGTCQFMEESFGCDCSGCECDSATNAPTFTYSYSYLGTQW